MNKARLGYYILRYLGPRVVWLRAGVYLRRHLGLMERQFQSRPWNQINFADITQPGTPTQPTAYAQFKRTQNPPFLFPFGQPPEIPAELHAAQADRRPSFSERLRLLEENRCTYFLKYPSPTPIDWHVNPFNGKRTDPSKTWTDLSDFDPHQGDIRFMWEPSRAAWAIDLARAHPHQMKVDAGALFWRWLDSWMEHSPPFKGVHWKCGQESSIRLIALAVGFWSVADEPATDPNRWVQFARLAWATGYRVAHHINYAISQKNNHALSEAVGLILVSQLFPEFRESAHWRSIGRRVLAQELRRQIYNDGSYLQNSMNYERIMLHISMLGLRLAELAGEPFERDIYERLGRCTEFFFQMMDPETGRVPNYGNNDGSCVLPLNECDIADYRPIVQAVYYLVNRRRLLPAGPWDEDLLWLFGSEAISHEPVSPRRPTSTAFDEGGYYTLRRENSWAMLRCHTYKDRMGHHDPLHLDLWWQGLNVVRDCGSHLYYDPERPALEHYFKSLAAHNTVQIDDAESLHAVSRFLWLPWSRAQKRHFETAGPVIWFEGEHYDYDRTPWNIVQRRTVISLQNDGWAVVDDILGADRHRAVVRWHLIDAPFSAHDNSPQVTLHTSKGDFSVIVASSAVPDNYGVARALLSPERVQGFAAPNYTDLQPTPTLEVNFRATLPLRVVTFMAPASALSLKRLREDAQGETWELIAARRHVIDLALCTRSTRRTYLGCRSEN